MTLRTVLNKTILGGMLASMALGAGVSAPSLASAQTYYRDGGYYDPCRREQSNRGIGGGLIGATLGAVIGSNVAARNARTEGALLGGAVGAVGGAVVGKNSAACDSGYAPRTSYRTYERRDYGSAGYGDSYTYERNRRAPAAYDDDYAYDGRGNSYVVTDRPPATDGCTLAESPIYLPDGRTQKRFVRVCPDSSGRYQVVD